MQSLSKKLENRRKERLSWFSEQPINETVFKDGFIYFKHWDGNNNRWTVSEFTKESWERMKGCSYRQGIKIDKRKEMEQASNELEEKYFID
jgi:hypothetical protein